MYGILTNLLAMRRRPSVHGGGRGGGAVPASKKERDQLITHILQLFRGHLRRFALSSPGPQRIKNTWRLMHSVQRSPQLLAFYLTFFLSSQTPRITKRKGKEVPEIQASWFVIDNKFHRTGSLLPTFGLQSPLIGRCQSFFMFAVSAFHLPPSRNSR